MKKYLSIILLLISGALSAQVKIAADGSMQATGNYPVTYQRSLKGYVISVKGLAERNAIPSNFRDTGMIILVRDSSYLYSLVGGIANSNWQLYSSAGSISGGDTTIFNPVIDSTGQAAYRVLYGRGNNKIGSDPRFLWDSVHNKLTINATNFSAGGNSTKLYVSGNVRFDGALNISNHFTFPIVDGTVNQALTTNGSGVVSWTGPYISPPDTAAMLSPYLRTNVAAATYRTQSQVRTDISLTTTGSSGAATYTPATGTLNIPQYSGGGASAPFADNSALIKNNGDNTKTALFYAGNISASTLRSDTLPNFSGNVLIGTYNINNTLRQDSIMRDMLHIQKVFMAIDYGEDTTGATDATVSIQNTINAAVNAGGGRVVISGKPKIAGAIDAGCNCQISIPATTVVNTLIIEGENGSLGGNVASSPFGTDTTKFKTTLYSTYSGTASTITPGTAVFAFLGQTLTKISVSFRNFNIQVKNNPNGHGVEIGGINADNAVNFGGYENLSYSIDTPFVNAHAPEREVYGFSTPNNDLGNSYYINNVVASNIRWGFVFGEHVYAPNIYTGGCWTGVGWKAGYHSSLVGRYGNFWDVNGTGYFYNQGTTPMPDFTILEFDQEYGAGNTSKYYNTLYSVDDTLSVLKGIIYYTSITQLSSEDSTKFLLNGGTGIGYYRIGDPNQIIAIDKTTTRSINSSLGSIIKNGSNGSSAGARFYFKNDNNIGGTIGAFSTTYSLIPAWRNKFAMGADSGIAISANQNVTSGGTRSIDLIVDGNAGSWDLRDSAKNIFIINKLAVGSSTTPTGQLDVTFTGQDGVRLIGSNSTNARLYTQATNAASQATLYFENNRGSFASYGGILYGGSTNAIGNLFGVSRADKLFFIADGANNLGMVVGNLANQFLSFGTNNTERARFTAGGNLLVGTTSDAASSKLTVESTTQGILPPRMTTTQKNAISSPAEGLMVYDVTLHKLYVWDGSTWQAAW